MENLLDLSFEELKEAFAGDKMPSARAGQIFDWVYKKFVFNFDRMSNLSKDLRAELKNRFCVLELEKLESAGSLGDETVKFLFRCGDGKLVETVLIVADEGGADDDEGPQAPARQARYTLCVSSQSGCPLGCRFCATGKLGFERDLSTGEVLSQVLWAEQFLADIPSGKKDTGRGLANIVFMGMGEPMLNYDRVMKAIRVLNDPKGYNLGIRHFTLSTAGIVPGIDRLSGENAQIRLAVSLHAADQAKRESLMPVAKKYPLEELSFALKAYQEQTGRRVTLEYILMEGINDGEEDIRGLRTFMNGLDANLNVIAYNEVEGLPYRPPSDNTVKRFSAGLRQARIPYVFRKSRGRAVKAACGQLGLYWKGLEKA